MSSLFYSMCSKMVATKNEYSKQRQKSPSQTASAEGCFCFRNWNVSRLDFYFQFTFQIQLPKLFDLSPCLLTRKRTLGLLSWELGAHVERLARIHILSKFSHTKGPAREKRKDESGSRRDFKGRAAAPGPAQAPPSADIRRGSRARAAFLRGGSARVPGSRARGRGPRRLREGPEGGPRQVLTPSERRLRKVFRKEGKDFHVQPRRRAVPAAQLYSSSHTRAIPSWGSPSRLSRRLLCAGGRVPAGGCRGFGARSRAARARGRPLPDLRRFSEPIAGSPCPSPRTPRLASSRCAWAEGWPAEPTGRGVGCGPPSRAVGGPGPHGRRRRRRRTPGARGRGGLLQPTPRGRVRLRAPKSVGPAGAGRPQAAGLGKDVFTVPRVLGYPGGRGEAGGLSFVCIRRRREEAEEPLGHKLPFPAPRFPKSPLN